MNSIIITGRITKDLELKTVGSGVEVCNFSVAVDRRRKDADGNKQTDFFDCSAFGKTAAFLTTYFHKGDGITIQGRMESRKWADKEGNNRVSWGIFCENIEFALGKSTGASNYSGPAPMEELPEDEGNLPF